MEGRFNGGFFALRVLGAYIWRGLYMERLIFGILRYIPIIGSFICIVVAPSTLNIITYILHTIFHTCPVVLTVVTGRIWMTIRPSSKDNRELKQPRRRRWRKPHLKKVHPRSFKLHRSCSASFSLSNVHEFFWS